jgi:nucleoid-associated protein YgaU|tara:strand:+ start:472 stop:783 length:312 start_codon:yes stop_codon:yes gene_type:complete
MERYKNINILKDKNGKKFLATTILPIIEPTHNDIYITGQIGDRLDNLSFKYYGDSTFWWIIARANNIGKGDFTVPLGMQIRIPDPSSIFEIETEYLNLNNSEN